MARVASWSNFNSLSVQPRPENKVLPRFSLTQDIVGYRRCPRQYGYCMHKGFVPAHTVQIFFGTILHEVLDRAHLYYKGYEDPHRQGKIPSSLEIRQYFDEVYQSLRARGVTAINDELRSQALRVLLKFNQIEGPVLYPLVVDTEHRVR